MFKNGYGSQLANELKEIREKGELKPVQFGFKSWNQYDDSKYLQASRGSTILIGGEPHHGKTYFTNELVMQLMEKHDFKIALFSTETGKTAKIFSIFYGMYIGKSYSKVRPDLKENHYAMTDDELDLAQAFVNKRLWVFEQNKKQSGYQNIENIYKLVRETEQAEDIKFDSVVIDPIYDIDDFTPKAEEVKRVLSLINYECEINDRVDIIVNHVSETSKYVDKNGVRKKFRAMADEFYGGKNNQRKAMLMILVERPSPNLQPETPDDFVPENQTNVCVLKAKPEGVAKMGVYPIFYDWKKRRYYEMINGDVSFAECTRFSEEKPYKQDNDLPTFSVNDAFDLKNNDDDPFPF